MAGNFAPYVTQPFCAPRVTSFLFTLVLCFITQLTFIINLRSVHKTCFPCKKLFDHHSCLPNGINLFYLPSFIALSVTSIIVLPFHTLRRGSSVGLPFIFLKLPYHSKLLRKMLFYPHSFLSEVIDFIHLWESLFYYPSLLAHSILLRVLISLLPFKILSNHPLLGWLSSTSLQHAIVLFFLPEYGY